MEEQEALIPDTVLRAAGYLHPGSTPAAGGAPSAATPPCASRRVFTAHFRRRGLAVASLTLYVAGRRVRQVSRRSSVRIDLRGRRGTVRVLLLARVRRAGRTVVLSDARTYHLCRAGRRGHPARR
jgi:hypothetical protein